MFIFQVRNDGRWVLSFRKLQVRIDSRNTTSKMEFVVSWLFGYIFFHAIFIFLIEEWTSRRLSIKSGKRITEGWYFSLSFIFLPFYLQPSIFPLESSRLDRERNMRTINRKIRFPFSEEDGGEDANLQM